VSVKAIKYGFNLARELGAAVLLLNVIEPELTAGNPDAGIFPDDALMACESKANEFLNRMITDYAANVETQIATPVGNIQKTIIDTATKWQANLIIAGTHGRTGLNKLFNGSVAESIIQHSPVPVLVVNP